MRDTKRSNASIALLWGIIILLSVFLFVSRASAAINPQINFQGKMANPDGTNVTNGTYSIVFSIYTVASGGSAVWTETQSSVSVTDGIFRVSLGSVTSLPGSVDFNGDSLFLGITVGADSEMTPRVRFTASPYAFNSDRLGGLASTGFIQLGQSASPQADASTNSAVFINKTAAGNIIQLQSSGSDVFTVSNSGDLIFGQNGNRSITVAQESTNAAGNNLSLAAGQGGAGAGNTGGLLVLQGGAGGGTNGNGGNLTVSAGAASGAGTVGAIIIRNPANSTNGFQIQNSTNALMLMVDTTNSRVHVGDPTADANAVLFVLDTKNTAGDPTGVMGSIYYNGALNVGRCFVNGFWRDCTNSPRTSFEYTNDIMSATSDNHVTWAVTGGTNTAIASLAARPGIVTHSTGGVATNSARVVSTNVSSVIFGGNTLWYWQSAVRIPTISDAAQTFTYRNGFIDSGTAESTDGCFFRYTHATNGGRWQGVCRNSNAETTCDTTVAMTAATWYRLDIIVNAAGNSVDFRTDGVSRCTVAANIPTAAARETGFGSMILKSVGTTARTADLDYMSPRAEFTTTAR